MNNGFKIVRKLYDVNNHNLIVPDLFEYTKSIKSQGILNDGQSNGSPAFKDNKEISKLQIKILSKIEKETNLKLYPTYNYFRIYNSQSILKSHIDRKECEISVTINIGYDGEYSWPIWMKGNDGKDYEVVLEPGDGVIYNGCENYHWRADADEKVICQTQAFIHFVNQNGPYEDCIYDEKTS